MLTEASSGRLATRLHPCPGASQLVVVFSQVRVPAGKFGLERLFSRTRHHCLFVNDTANGWYLGLDEALDQAINAAIAEVRPQEVIYYGASMGGYGALETGLRRGDGSVHAFAPELILGVPGSKSARHAVVEPGDQPPLQERLPQASLTFPFWTYFGVFEGTDARGAASLLSVHRGEHSSVSKLNILPLRSCHACHDHLYSLNLIRRITSTFTRDPATEVASKGLLADPEIDANVEVLRGFAEETEQLAAGGTPDVSNLLSLFERSSGNPGILRLAAESSAAAGDFSEALAIMLRAEKIIEADSVLHTLPKRWRKAMPLRRVEWLIELQQTAAAGDLLRIVADTYPVDEAMLELAGKLDVDLSKS